MNGSVSHSMWPALLLGCGPSSVRAFGPATFPVGEGDLPAGEHSSGHGFHFQGSPPHPARATPGPPSPSRGRLPPGGGAFIGGRLSLSGVPSTPGPGYARSTLSKQERAVSRRGKAQRAFSGPCVFWHCMVQCPKNRQAPGGKGGFFCPVSRPSRPLWSPL